MNDFFRDWFGSGRGVGNPTRSYIGDSDAFIAWIQENEKRGICSYASVQPFKAYEDPSYIEKLFYDFDCKEDPEKAGIEARRFAHRLRKFYDVDPILVFSGNKGFHVYVFLQAPFGRGIEKETLRDIYKKLMLMLIGKSKYLTLDSSVIGDIKQLARIPYTHHEKTGTICHPVKDHQPLEYTPGLLDHYRRSGLSLEFCKQGVYKLAETKKEEEQRKATRRPGRRNYPPSIRPCIARGLETQLRHEAGHKMRVAIVAELNANGWGANRIIGALSNTISDYDEKKTRYYVTDIIKKGYKPSKCETIMILDYCIDSECRIFRSRKKRGRER